MWDNKLSTLVEGYRHYVAFAYLYETAHRHVTEGCNFIDVLEMKLCLFSVLPLMTRQWCIICLSFTCTFSFSCTVTQPFSIFC
jgi:hypothetical protein